jgi:hypothetical protein
MSNSDPSAASHPAQGGGASVLAVLPALWVVLNMVFAAYGTFTSLPLLYDYQLPDSALDLIYANAIASVVNGLWGLYLVGLAISRSVRFPRHFIIWQVANLIWIAAREIYVLVTPDFVVSLRPLLYAAGEMAIGIVLILLLKQRPEAAKAYSNTEMAGTPVIVTVIIAFLGIVLGGALGFGGGLLGGALIAEVSDMSCFEGACGFFAFFMGLAGMLAGAIGGGIFAIWRANRKKPLTQ